MIKSRVGEAPEAAANNGRKNMLAAAALPHASSVRRGMYREELERFMRCLWVDQGAGAAAGSAGSRVTNAGEVTSAR